MKFILNPNELDSLTEIVTYLEKKFNTDKEYVVEIKVKSSTRSTLQNAYYWGVVVESLWEYLGGQRGDAYDLMEIHEYLKSRFNGAEITIGRLSRWIGKTTTTLTTVEMEAYLESIRNWAARDLGLFIPEPNDAPGEYRYEK